MLEVECFVCNSLYLDRRVFFIVLVFICNFRFNYTLGLLQRDIPTSKVENDNLINIFHIVFNQYKENLVILYRGHN